MSIFSHKMEDGDPAERISRIPYANFSLLPYIIKPKTKYLSRQLNKFLKEYLKSGFKCVDGQNGNVFDNMIEDWENRAKAELATQRADRSDIVKNMASSVFANYKNAQDWIERDTIELQKIQKQIDELSIIYDELNKDSIFG